MNKNKYVLNADTRHIDNRQAYGTKINILRFLVNRNWKYQIKFFNPLSADVGYIRHWL